MESGECVVYLSLDMYYQQLHVQTYFTHTYHEDIGRVWYLASSSEQLLKIIELAGERYSKLKP